MRIGFKNRKRMRGVSIAFFSIGSFTMTALTGLTVDGTAMYIERLQCQMAADAAALAAAQYACPTGSQRTLTGTALLNAINPIVTEKGKLLASHNKVDNAKATMTWPYTGNNDWVGSTVSREYTFKFLAAIGFNKANITAKAIAEAGSHEDDRFQDDTAALGRLAVDITGMSVVDSWDSRSDTYANQATNTDSHTGLKYAFKGANVRSDCLIKIRGKNYISGSALVAGDGIDCSELASHLDHRANNRDNDGDELEVDSGSPRDMYHPDGDGGHQGDDDGHSSGSGHGYDDDDDGSYSGGHSSGGDDDDDGHAKAPASPNGLWRSLGALNLVLASGGDDDDDGGHDDGGHDSGGSSGGSCMPTCSAAFTANNLTVTATSNKDLINVIVKWCDNTTSTYSGLSGLNRTFTGTGTKYGKTIKGAWIKSGCNSSGTTGVWYANAAAPASCESDGETGDGDVLLHGRNRKRDGDYDRYYSTKWLERCLKAYGQEYTADNDDDVVLRHLAQDMEDEGKEYKERAKVTTGAESFKDSDNGQKLCDRAGSLRTLADSIASQSWTSHNKPKSWYSQGGHVDSGSGGSGHDEGSPGHDSDGDGHDSEQDNDGPGERLPHVPHCGIIEVRGTPNHIQKDAIADGPIIFRGSPKVTGQIMPFHDVDPLYNAMTKPTWGTVATTNNNSALATFGTKWNSTLRRLRFRGRDDVTIPAGNYYIKDLIVSGQATVRIDPGVTFWIDGRVRIGGHADVNPALDPKRLTINMKCPATGTCYKYRQDFQARGKSRVAALVFNEDGDIDLAGDSEFFGNLVSGMMIQIRGTSSVHLDRAAAAATNRCGRHSRLIF